MQPLIRFGELVHIAPTRIDFELAIERYQSVRLLAAQEISTAPQNLPCS